MFIETNLSNEGRLQSLPGGREPPAVPRAGGGVQGLPRESVDVAFADVAFQECENWVFKEKALIRTRMRFAPC